MSQHPTTPLTHPTQGYTVNIDVEIAPLIQRLWEEGIETAFCCQGCMSGGNSDAYDDPEVGRAYINFVGLDDFMKFITKVSTHNDIHMIEEGSEYYENYPSTLFDRIYRCPMNRWDFNMSPRWVEGKPAVSASIYFPSHDIKEIIKALDKKKPDHISVTTKPTITDLSQCTT